MRRIIIASLLILAAAATASAQGLTPSVWQSQRGGLLKVLSVDAAGISREFSSVVQQAPVRGFLIIWSDGFGVLWWFFRRRGTGHPTAT